MKVTTEMIDAAMKKAIEAGLLPRHARRDELSINRELIRMVLMAALEDERLAGKSSSYPAAAADERPGRNAKPRELPGLAAGYALSR